MREPALVGDCVAAMAAAAKVPVTVKCRIGVDEQQPREALYALVERIAAAARRASSSDARKAWLEGLSPRDNRAVPPLDYAIVYALKAAYPRLPIAVNGGVGDLEAAREHLRWVDGAMVGRAAYQNPEMLIGVDPEIFGEPASAGGDLAS